MVKFFGGTRAILAYMLIGAAIAACFVKGVSDVKFTALMTLATTVAAFYFANKATMDQTNK